MIAALWVRLWARPWVRWVTTWGLSLLSLVSGALTLALFRRGLEYIPWIVGYLLLVWLAGVVFAHAREALEARGRRWARLAYEYTLQSLYWHLLLFLLPIYYASATLASRNLVFLLVLAGFTLFTAIDPWYRAAVRRSVWPEWILFWFALFAALKVALPLLRVPSALALVLAAAVSALALTPAVRRRFRLSWKWAGLAGVAASAAVGFVAWQARAWIPPAPLFLVQGTFAREVRALEPVMPVSRLSAAEAHAWGGLVCFTAVAAPAGLREAVLHIWHKDGTVLAQVPLAPVRGGRPGGFRTFSRLKDPGGDPVGGWWVDVMSVRGQLIGRVRLTVYAP